MVTARSGKGQVPHRCCTMAIYSNEGATEKYGNDVKTQEPLYFKVEIEYNKRVYVPHKIKCKFKERKYSKEIV